MIGVDSVEFVVLCLIAHSYCLEVGCGGRGVGIKKTVQKQSGQNKNAEALSEKKQLQPYGTSLCNRVKTTTVKFSPFFYMTPG